VPPSKRPATDAAFTEKRARVRPACVVRARAVDVGVLRREAQLGRAGPGVSAEVLDQRGERAREVLDASGSV
jgi:hypothetical protein